MLGLDYAGGRPGGVAIKTAGYDFVVRYLSDGGPGLPGKILTLAEYRDLQACGVAVVVNWETTADRMKSGRTAGIADAQQADTAARGVGHPPGRPIYFSCDFDAAPSDQVAIDAYLRGAATVIGQARVGIYGGFWPVSRALDNGTAAWAWQTGAWSGGNVDPRIHIYQRIRAVTVGGVECDVNEARRLDFGQHPQPTQEDVMAGIENIPIDPGSGVLPLGCPVGSGSQLMDTAWVSLFSKGPLGGAAKFWFQSDGAGISSVPVGDTAPEQIQFSNGHSSRLWAQVPDGTTMIRVEYDLPSGGVVTLETKPKQLSLAK